MKNYVQDPDSLTLTAPYAVASGAGAKVGLIFAVAVATLANGAVGAFNTQGVFDLDAVTADTASVGAAAYWDDSAKKITTTVGSNLKVGVFLKAKANGDTTARIRLNGTF